MGSACKADPSRIHLADLSETQEDRLAKAVRSRLKAFGIFSGIPVVYSTERSKVSILPFEAPEEGTADE
jgi:tRNA A37 threonylcarbamoyladenosine dehydratase